MRNKNWETLEQLQEVLTDETILENIIRYMDSREAQEALESIATDYEIELQD